ncbi:trigger factor [Caldicellulosiruptoraceae bacterium PP1]
MEYKIEHKEKNKVTLEVEIPAEKFEESVQKSYIKNAKYFKIPGFRPGKAPRGLIEKQYGEEVFFDDAIDFILNETYPQVVKEANLQIVSQPKVDIVQIGKGKSFIYKAEVFVKPEFELGQYKDIEIEKVEYIVSDEQVEHELEHMREDNARFITIEDRPAQDGDLITIDFEGFVDDKPFEGNSANDYQLQLGSNTFIPGFEEQIVGMNKGEEKTIDVVFPEDYHAKDLAGKPAKFRVVLKEIKVKELPELDDEFAKDVSEFETLAELKEDIRKKFSEKNKEKEKDEMTSKILDKIAENTPIDIPDSMIENQIDYYIEESERTMRYFGYTLDSYLKAVNKTIEEYRQQFKDRAYIAVRNNLLLEKIAKVENIEANEEEIQKEIEKLASSYKMEVEKFRENLKPDDIEYIKEGIIINKALDLIYNSAKIVEKNTEQKDA